MGVVLHGASSENALVIARRMVFLRPDCFLFHKGPLH